MFVLNELKFMGIEKNTKFSRRDHQEANFARMACSYSGFVGAGHAREYECITHRVCSYRRAWREYPVISVVNF